MNRYAKKWRRGRRAIPAAIAVLAATFVGATGAARADNSAPCSSSTEAPYSMQLTALTGRAGADVAVTVAATGGCALPATLKKVQLKTFDADGSLVQTRNLTDVDAPGGKTGGLDLGDVPRDRRIDADVLVQTGTPARTYVLRGTARTLLRPDLVVEEIAPRRALAGKPVVISAVIGERNGDVGASALVSMSALPGATEPVVVPAGGRVTVSFAAVTFATPVPVDLTVEVTGAAPTETNVGNNTRSATLDLTANELPTPKNVLFPSLGGYGAQFGMHLYAPITPWPAGVSYGDAEAKVKALEPQLVRIFYNDNWDGNANGLFPDWQVNYASFVKVVQLAQEAGATINISFQNLGAARLSPGPAMAKFADVLEELVRTYGLTNVSWAEVGNEPNAPGGLVTLEQYNALYRALDAQLVARGLRGQIHLMGGGLVESGGARHHYAWMQYIAQNMGDVVDAYAEHIYWIYDTPGRLEYRLRDTYNLMTKTLPAGQQKPSYMMEFGIRGYNTCTGKPALPSTDQLYYRDAACTDIWRTNIAGFQQLWFNVDAAQLGVAGTSKWDAYWSMYDRSSPVNQLYWMVGPPTEGSPLTPTYWAMSLLFHTTAPGWQIIGLEPWESNDWSVPAYAVAGGNTSDDAPEQELAAYAGPNGELTIVGLDTRGRDLNTASSGAPSAYSIGGLPPNTRFNLAVWNATGEGTNSIADPVTTNAAGVARFDVPLQAAFALTTVPVS
jgi:hypothetical protein